jgi:hypothetical protein
MKHELQASIIRKPLEGRVKGSPRLFEEALGTEAPNKVSIMFPSTGCCISVKGWYLELARQLSVVPNFALDTL